MSTNGYPPAENPAGGTPARSGGNGLAVGSLVLAGQEPILAKLIGVFSSSREVEAAKQSLLRFDGYREAQAGFRSHELNIDEGIDGELSHEILFGR